LAAEELLLRREPRSLAPLVETIAGDTSIAHTWAYAAAIEQLAEIAVPDEIEAARGVMLELERVAMHLSGLAGMSADIGFLQGAATYGRLRTTAINASMRACGSRFGRGAIRPGGSGVGASTELRRNMTLIQEDIALINDHFLSA